MDTHWFIWVDICSEGLNRLRNLDEHEVWFWGEVVTAKQSNFKGKLQKQTIIMWTDVWMTSCHPFQSCVSQIFENGDMESSKRLSTLLSLVFVIYL